MTTTTVQPPFFGGQQYCCPPKDGGCRERGCRIWSLRQKLDSPRQEDRRLGQSNAQKRLFDRPGLSTFWRNDNTRHDKEVPWHFFVMSCINISQLNALSWLMLRPPINRWLKLGVGLLASQWCSPAEALQSLCARIEICGALIQIFLARTSPGDIVGPDVMFLERLWDFSRFSQIPMCVSRP